ncbi:unnamed protein product [Staurois parvus]|uniref:Uncharacterized protein n=1 Tax=Staurois parvus TaxID=386267 RepID=A0ABN9ARJ2_9NEOB|nr:unnamed protein product [Staurois parvus]
MDFYRSYAGKNAHYGNGDVLCSGCQLFFHDTYSRPDGSGYKYMYLSRCGHRVSCVGKQGMVAPPF